MDTLPPLIPRSVLFGNPDRMSPKISPDGTRLAYLAPRDGVVNVWVRSVAGGDDRPVTRETVRPIRAFYWSEDGRYLLYPQDAGGDENFHLFAAEADGDGGSAIRELTPFPGVRAGLVATSPDVPGSVVLTMNRRDPRLMDAYRCDLATGELTLAAENPGGVVGWVADDALAVRAATVARPDGGTDVLVREGEGADWRTLLSVPFGEEASPIDFAADSSLYVLTNRDVNTLRLYAADPASGALTLLHSREDVDLGGIALHPTRRNLQAVAYNHMRREWVVIDPDIAPDFAAISEQLSGDWSLLSRDRADERWVVAETLDTDAPRYYLYTREGRRLDFLFSAREELANWTLAPMTPVEIPARDGLTLPSYLTLPVGVAPKSLPMVIFVHGGPWARDTWGLSPDVQWLANRGYAVLQVNYRGSTGFGKAFVNAGNREWGGRMHDDLVDAVQWAVAQGYADPARVAIMGGSYGGYATLAGLTFTPELFACGVDVVGPSSIATLIRSIPPYWEPLKQQFLLRVGDPDTEPEFVESRSPLTFADRIVRPLLVAQGANDPRVKKHESDQIVAAARKNGKDVLYLLFEDEGHGFARPENRIKYCAAAEEFLARHLGGRFEPAHPGEEPPIVE
jgi:Dipeptidyl aminopeptidases/acylaminoacyl-peptidases